MNHFQSAALAAILTIVIVQPAPAAPTRKTEPPPPAETTAADMHVVRATARELAKQHGSEHVLVVYDIDNTLLTSSTPLGSDQWFTWQEDSLKAGLPDSIAKADFECLLDAQELLYVTRPMRLTHESVRWSIEALRDEGFTQWVITSRGPELATVTFRELERQRLAFSNFHGETRTAPEDLVLDGRSARLQDGVVFTSGGNKGVALSTVLYRVGKTGAVKAIVFVDDTPKHLPNMRGAFVNSGIEVRTFLYEGVKAEVDAFKVEGSVSKAEAKTQWCELAKDVPSIERSFASDVMNLSHVHKDGSRHALSACIVDVCK